MTILYAKVTEVTGSDFKVTFLGEEQQGNMTYNKLENYIPKMNDVVAIIEDKHGKKLVIGRVS